MVTFFWENKYEDPMQATAAVQNHKSLPRIPTQGRKTKTNEMNPISPLTELNCTGTRTPRLPLTILNRSTPRPPPTPNSNTKRTKTASLPHIGNLPSLYSHSNHSGDLLSGSRSPIAPVRSNPTLSISTRHWIPLRIQRRLPPTSLLRSRRKLWKKYWLVVDLPTIPELTENIHEIEIESVQQLRSRSGNVIPRKPPLYELQSTQPLSKYPPRVVSESLPPPPPPELDDDTGSESSSSDEDLDAYEFDLSCCSPSSVDMPIQPAGIYDKPKDSRLTQHCDASVRVANHLETDISSIYESISRRNLTRIPL